MSKQQVTIEVDVRSCFVCGATHSSGFYLSRNERWPGRWCRACFKRWERRGDPTSKQFASRGEPLNWLRNMLQIGNPEDCWNWPFAKNRYGYGHTTFNGELIKASHLALKLSGNERPDGMFACHSCDNPACCNPSHLRWDTAKANSQDAVKRGRCRGGIQRGEASGVSKLTNEQVLEIVRLVASGQNKKDVAALFCVVPTTVCNITNGKNWAHVTNIDWRQSKRRRPT